MTANVTIEIARRSNILRAPAAAIRFRPTADMFMALKQPVPEDLNRGFGRGGAGTPGGGRAGFNGASGRPGGAAPQAEGAPQGGAAPQGGSPAGDRPAGDAAARRQSMEQRMANMSPEERERFQSRMREGGQPQAPAPKPPDTTGAQTIDAMFAPVQVQEGRARIWLYENNQLRSVNVRTGISDGTWIEIVSNGDASELQPGSEVVTNLVTGVEPAARPGQQGAGSNPLMPQQRGRGPGGGGRGR